jgi:two-component system sensor histidine kinase SenX3
VYDVVGEAVDRCTLAAEAKHITVAVGGESGGVVYGDHDLLVTAVRNLVDNAIAYSPDRTRIGVSVRRTGGLVEIAVSDQGIGIAHADQQRIFERFYRVDQARSRATGGPGLGLSIVKHVAANHGGEVTVWSAEGQGSTFTLRLPESTDLESVADSRFVNQTPVLAPGPVDHSEAIGPAAVAGAEADVGGRVEGATPAVAARLMTSHRPSETVSRGALP